MAERDEVIRDIMTRTGKTREQVEAFFTMVGSAMGWRSVSDDEFREAYDAFAARDAATGQEEIERG